MNKKYKIGYTQGTFDMFHIGHLNLLNHAKEQCEYLIVGINSDTLVEAYKNKTPIINAKERAEIVGNIKVVDCSIIVDTLDKVKIWNEIHFNAIFIGDDWKGNPRWIQTEQDFLFKDVQVVYLKHTDGVSSTMLRKLRDVKMVEYKER